MSHRLLLTATSGAAAATIDGMTIHSACKFSKDASRAAAGSNDASNAAFSRATGVYVDGQEKMDRQEKDMLVVDEVSIMLGAQTLYLVNQ